MEEEEEAGERALPKRRFLPSESVSLLRVTEVTDDSRKNKNV